MPVITFSDAAFTYGENAESGHGFTPISFEVAAGETVLICGESGAGKSTILQAINGLVPNFHKGTFTGEITAAGHNPTTASLYDTGCDIAMVFQSPKNQFFAIKVRDELAFGSENRGIDPSEIMKTMEQMSAEYGISHLLHRDVLGLSGGQQQMVACASAQMDNPTVILFDEPASNLHPDAITTLTKRLHELKSQGFTLVIAEHRLYYLRDLVDKVVYVRAVEGPTIYSAADFYALDNQTRLDMGLRTIVEPMLPEVSCTTVNQVLNPETAMQRADSSPLEPTLSGVNQSSDSVVQSSDNSPVEPAVVGASQGSDCVVQRADNSPLEPAVAGTSQTPNPAGQNTKQSAGLHLTNVTFRYPDKAVLGIPDLVIPSGCVNALIGPNGAGKSTLASSICGLIRAKGTFSFNGEILSARNRLKRSYLVMQDVHRQLFAPSVLDELRTHNPKLTVEEAHTLLETIGMQDYAQRHPLSLSGGQKQRLVALGARVANKEIFIFDEPSSGLDVTHLHTIATIMQDLADQGKTVIVISHDNELLHACAGNIIQLLPIENEEANQ